MENYTFWNLINNKIEMINKFKLIRAAFGFFCLCTALEAEVPSLINYQGRLTDSGGTPVNGAIDVVLRVYDAKTEGKMVYEETISQVSVVNGVYSFGYGSAGKTVKRAAEVVAVADGETKVFNYTTEYKPLLGDVQLSDGSYTWGTLSGPSDATQFIGSVNAELGNVTGIYIQNAPDADKIVNVVYHYHEEGIVGALSQNKECWQELTINGKTLTPRERLVSVPFALVSAYSKRLSLEKKVFRIPYAQVYVSHRNGPQMWDWAQFESFPVDLVNNPNFQTKSLNSLFHIPPYMSQILSLRSRAQEGEWDIVFLSVKRKNNETEIIKISNTSKNIETKNIYKNLNHNDFDYFIEIRGRGILNYVEFDYH